MSERGPTGNGSGMVVSSAATFIGGCMRVESESVSKIDLHACLVTSTISGPQPLVQLPSGHRPSGRLPSQRQPCHSMLAPYQVRRLTAYILDNLGLPIRCSDMASLVGLSLSHFMRCFHC